VEGQKKWFSDAARERVKFGGGRIEMVHEGELNRQTTEFERKKAETTTEETRRSQLFSEMCTATLDPSQSHPCSRQRLKATAQKATQNLGRNSAE
jgi:hypothetical protein